MTTDQQGLPNGDPSTRTTALIDRAISAFREVMEARLDGMDTATRLVAESLEKLPAGTSDAHEHLRAECTGHINALRELIESRIAAMDKATELLAETVGKVPSDTDKAVSALRELLESRINGMDKATELLARSLREVPTDVEKSAAAIKQIIETRLAAMDEATKLLATNVDKVPYAILQEAGNLKAFIMSRIDDVSHVSEEKFTAIEGTFASNALALAAALAAQKEAAAETNKSNTLAIDRANSTTKETILANAAQTSSGLASQAATIADLKDRIVRIESGAVGAAGQRTEQRLNTGQIIAVISVILLLIGTVITVVLATHA